MTLPNDLAEAVDNYLWSQEVPPTLTAVVQTALREYLREQGFLQLRRPLKIRPAKRGSGGSDVTENHDLPWRALRNDSRGASGWETILLQPMYSESPHLPSPDDLVLGRSQLRERERPSAM
jgi:hypothetical protein